MTHSRIRRAAGWLAACLCLVPATISQARPAHKRALVEYLGGRLVVKLNDCRSCHLAAEPGSDPALDDRPHNAFGARLKSVRSELKAKGKSAGLIDRIEAIADEDSDKDGAPNLLELVTGHHPGDAADHPAESDRARDLRSLAEFRAGNAGARWTPFETVKRPDVPAATEKTWVRNPIDAFIARQREAKGIPHRPEADRAILLRRVTLDVTGLPPTPEETRAFLEDKSDDAYEKVVDRLLLSPAYGERWGRHWMDVWRYSDWAGWGTQVRDSKPHIWHWRDWIVESLNKDKGYDRMVVEMLAADEAAPGDLDAARATGYLVRNYKLLSREKWMQDTVDHTAMAFLGITMNCAKCHDHMYDPIAQKEYYKLRAIFTPHNVRTDRVPGEPSTEKDGIPLAFDADPAAPTFVFIRGDDRTPGKDPVAPGVPEFLGGKFEVKPVELPLEARDPEARPHVAVDDLAAADRQVSAAEKTKDRSPLQAAEYRVALASRDALKAEIRAEALERAGRKDTPEWKVAATEATAAQRGRAAAEAARKSELAFQARRKTPAAKRAEADLAHAKAEKERLAAEALAARPADVNFARRQHPAYPKTSTGRRLAFARWITARDNPLAARVAVNHIWLRHFGQAIVPSVFDFGKNGRKPTHPDLLDWLAAEFMDRGWSMRTIHRLILTSSTYRQASTPDARALSLDPDNLTYWRFVPRRLEAEAVRDAMLALGGDLDPRMGGADIDHKLGLSVPRRSIYFQHAAEKQMTFLQLFDAATVTECYERRPSIMPQQALALANSDLALKEAAALAGRLDASAGKDSAAFVADAFERVLGRVPTSAEREACLGFLASREEAETRSKRPDARLRARSNLVHVLFNHHEFVTIR